MVVKEIENTSVVDWVGAQLTGIHVPHLEHKQVYFYKKCVFGPMTIAVGDFVLVSNADAAEPDTDSGCDIAKVLYLYELYDTNSNKDPYRAVVQWYSRPECVPMKFFDRDDLCIDFNLEVIEEYRPYDHDISIETIFRKCYVVTGSSQDSASGLLAKINRTKNCPMFVCRYKFIKLKNSSYTLVPLEYFEEEFSEKRSARKSVSRRQSTSKSSAKKKRTSEVEFVDVDRMDENKVSPIKIVGGNSVVKLSSKKMTSSTNKEINANYLSSPLTEKNQCPITPTSAKALAARRNLNISLDNAAANLTHDSDIMNYSIIKSTPESTSQNLKIKLRLSESQKGPNVVTRRSSMRKSIEEHIEDVNPLSGMHKERKRLAADDVSYVDIYHTPSKKTKDTDEVTKSTRRKSILKSASSRVAEGTPKRNIQLSNIVERRIFINDDAVMSTPKRGRPPKRKDGNEASDEEYSAPKTPTRKSPASKHTSPEATQMTPSQKLKLMRSGSLKATIDSRQASKTDRRKSDLQIARERLHVSVVPKSLPCRETEFLNIYTFLEGKIQDQCGGCMYVSGVPGTGKTATVTGVIRELQRVSAEDKLPDFEFIEINGMRLTEPRQAYVQIYRQLTGKTVSWEHAHSLLEKRFTTPAPRRTTTVLLVDELDILCNRRQDVVYNLLDWPTKSAARLVVVTIANTMDLPERLLMGKVTSRLGLTRLTFQPYSHKQLQEIVIGRLSGSEAFKGDAVQLVARKVAAVSGDARRALDICRRATEIADAQTTDAKIVNMMHVQQALSEMISSAKVLAIKKCSRLEQIFLQAVVAEVTRTGVEETNFMGVYSQIETISAFMGAPVPTPGLALRICSKLGAERLIICEHSRTDIFQKILLNVSMDDIHYALRVESN
ncbi:origin recognition complex subunit 1 [Episyrphus balteatus]|uniref:origin recognition complex subunit 1 n=1 Tax=Episyrphus balteatus TaxID=286459 RepID=UPI002484DA2A|nr:origin recognition complex subunit 1 [Episyrphus balteatus]